MADQKHLARLRQGIKKWNTWRGEHLEIQPDLRGADLSGANLSEADLSGANLDAANLRGAELSEANLHEANLSYSTLEKANFTQAKFIGANLYQAMLTRANLTRSTLIGANLTRANLIEADLSNVTVGFTIFTDIDLRKVKGLETIDHQAPSSIGIDTLYKSQGQIPESFLRKAGVPNDFLTYLPSLVNRAIEYYTCFLSYSSQNEDFARRLYADLQANGVRCWFAPEHLKIGEKYHDRIFDSIRLYDKLLLILSEQSVTSGWVQAEVEAALHKEYNKNREILFPVRLDNAVLETPTEWAKLIQRTRHIGDFIHWKDHDAYQQSFTRLLHDLQTERPPRSRKSSNHI